MRRILPLTCLVLLACVVQRAAAAIIPFDLTGKAGTGLLTGNENPTVLNGGSGGEVGVGISFDTSTNVITINVAWGSANGFTNLTGNATGGHIHGPTLDPAPTSFTESAGILVPLDSLAGWNASASAGGFSGTANIPAANVSNLLAGQLYINVHTSTNGGGEIRGYLVQAPEPGSIALIGCAASMFLMARRLRRLALRTI
jgi:hypothetical protein